MSAPLFPPASSAAITGRRSAPRVRLCLPAEIQLLQGVEKCLLDDLSQHGARVTLSGRVPPPGSGAVLQVHGLDAFGTVVWAKGQRLGLAFDDEVPLEVVVAIRHYADEQPAKALRSATFGHARPWLR